MDNENSTGKSKSSKAVKNAARPTGQRKNALQFDLLYQLSYMSVIAATGVPRNQIFAHAAQTECATAEHFRKVELACTQLQYDYAKACQIVGETVAEEETKGILLRFSSSLLSGEPEKDFLIREAEAQSEFYYNDYGQKLEGLKLWTDAYISLMLSAVLVVIVGIVSTMVWKIEMSLIVALVAISLMVTATGVWLIYIMCPREFKVLVNPGSNEQKIAHKLFRLASPAIIAVCGVLLAIKVHPGIAMLAAGAMVFPMGLISRLDDKKIDRRDSEIAAFVRSLGGVASATGTTVRDAVGRLDLNAIHYLRKEVDRLRSRLSYGIRTGVCWARFVEETGSEIAKRTIGMFYDALNVGGEAGQAGYHASLFANKVSLLRARRKTVASPFTWLCIAMHSATVALLVFVTQIISIFSGMVKTASQGLPKTSGASVGTFSSFNFSGLEMLNTLVIPLVVVFTVANAVAPSIADGGSRYKIFFNLGITAFISGLSLIILPKMADMLFLRIKM